MIRIGRTRALACAALAGVVVAAPARAQDRWLGQAVPDHAVRVDTGMVFHSADTLTLRFDLYRPTAAAAAPLPMVIIYNGFASREIRQRPQHVDWGRYLASSGLAAINYDSHADGQVQDFDALRAHLVRNATALGIDPAATGILAWSGHAFTGYPLAMDPQRTDLSAAVFLYGLGPSPYEPRLDLPTLFVRAGLDEVGLNVRMDSIAGHALRRNAPVSVINHSSGIHGFDGAPHEAVSEDIVAAMVAFLRSNLSAETRAARAAGMLATRAASALYNRDWPGAVAGYEAMVRADSTNTTLRMRLGHALTGAGAYRRALAEYQRTVDLGDGRLRDISNGAVVAAAGLRDFDLALPWLNILLQRGYTQEDLWNDARLQVFREEARFRVLLGH